MSRGAGGAVTIPGLCGQRTLWVALPLDTTDMGLDLDFNNGGGFGAGKRPERLPQMGQRFSSGSGHRTSPPREGETIATTMALTAGLLPPLFWAVGTWASSSRRAPDVSHFWSHTAAG